MNTSRKGKAFEQAVVNAFKEAGFDARRTRLSGHGQERPSDFRVIIGQRYYSGECKRRKDGWKELYNWTYFADMAVIRADKRHALVVLPLETLLEMVKAAERRE